MRYFIVINQIKSINSKTVQFWHDNRIDYTGLVRKDKSCGLVIWKLVKDGIAVHEAYVAAYRLNIK